MSISITNKYLEQKSRFSYMKNAFCAAEMNFDLYYIGNIVKIKMEDGKTKRTGSIDVRQGMFLPRITNKVVKKRLDSGEYVAKNIDPMRSTNNTIMYNSDGIKDNLLKPCVAVDIVACYWTTAFNLGVIDQNTFDKGMAQDREYKDARNISIGSIGAMTIHEKYVSGKLILTERYRREGACARLDIIDSVWDMANRIAKKLGPDFLMYLTDCFFVPEERKNDLCSLIEEEGYNWKAEECFFTKVRELHSGIGKTGERIFTEEVWWYLVAKEKHKLHDFSFKHNHKF